MKKKEQFLITGYPRSGTQYTAQCLRWLGYGITTENDRPHSQGIVSWWHTPKAKDYGKVALQIRNPLNAIASAQTQPKKWWEEYVVPYIGKPHSGYTVLDMALYMYPRWHELGLKHAGFTYRVEDIKIVYTDLMEFLELEPEWTNLVPITQNTRKGKYKELTWEDLAEVDGEDYNKTLSIAEYYGY